jgi:hypothetical protein
VATKVLKVNIHRDLRLENVVNQQVGYKDYHCSSVMYDKY